MMSPGARLAALLGGDDEEDLLGLPKRKKMRGIGYINDTPYTSVDQYYRSKTPQEIFSQYTPSAPPPLNIQTPNPRPMDEFASVESEYTPYRPDKPVGPPTGAPTSQPLDPRDYRQEVIKDEPARPLFSGMLPSQFPEAYQIGYTPPTAQPPVGIAPAASETPVAVNPDAERLAAALQAQEQQEAQMRAMQEAASRQAEVARQAEAQRAAEAARQAEAARLAALEEERRRLAAEQFGVDDGSGR
jgi:hypothetical protein